MDDHGNTNHHPRPEGITPRLQVWRFKVVRGTSRPDPAEPADESLRTPADCYICHRWDGVNEGTDEYAVKCDEGRLPGDDIYAVQPYGGTDATNPETATTPGDPTTESPVIWREMFVVGRQYWIEITGSEPIAGANNRYTYGWEIRVPNRHGTFKAPAEPETSGTTGVPAYNTVEANNSGSGVQGNSADLDVLPVGVSIKPVSGHPVVKAYPIVNCDGDPEMVFSYENALTDICPAPV
jgi:hypothetical protein